MSNKFQNLTVDYKQLMSIPIQERVTLAKSQLGSTIFGDMSPTQIAKLFPSYYQKNVPDVNGFMKATSGTLNTGTGSGKSQSGGLAPVEKTPPTLAAAVAQQANMKRYGAEAASIDNATRHENMRNVYNAYRAAGLSHKQALAFTAEVGRENNYNPDLMFGTHRDLNGYTNGGLVSMQKDRLPAMMNYLASKGLLDENGNMIRSQATLIAQAQFQVQEINEKYPRTKKEFLDNPDIDPEQAAVVLGDDYIRWARKGNPSIGFSAEDAARHDQGRQKNYYEAEAVVAQENPHLKDGTDAASGTLQTDSGDNETTGPKPEFTITPDNIATYTELNPKIEQYAQNLPEDQRDQFYKDMSTLGSVERINQVANKVFGTASYTPQEPVNFNNDQYKLTDKMGNMIPQPRSYDPATDDPGSSLPGEFNYSISSEGIKNLGLANPDGSVSRESIEAGLVTVETEGGVKVQVHQSIAKKAQGFLNELERRGYPLRQQDTGGYSWRNKSKGGGISTHATGTTIDLNAGSNEGTYGDSGNIDLPPDVEKLANYYGFSWGAKFGDPMHFETMAPDVAAVKMQELIDSGYVEKVQPDENLHVQKDEQGNVTTDAATVPLQTDTGDAPQTTGQPLAQPIEPANLSETPAPNQPEAAPAPETAVETSPAEPTAEPLPENPPDVPKMAQGGFIDQKDNLQVVDKETGDVKAEINNGELNGGIQEKGSGLEVKANATREADGLLQKYDNNPSPKDESEPQQQQQQQEPIKARMMQPEPSQAGARIDGIQETDFMAHMHNSLNRAYGLSRARLNYGNLE